MLKVDDEEMDDDDDDGITVADAVAATAVEIAAAAEIEPKFDFEFEKELFERRGSVVDAADDDEIDDEDAEGFTFLAEKEEFVEKEEEAGFLVFEVDWDLLVAGVEIVREKVEMGDILCGFFDVGAEVMMMLFKAKTVFFGAVNLTLIDFIVRIF